MTSSVSLFWQIRKNLAYLLLTRWISFCLFAKFVSPFKLIYPYLPRCAFVLADDDHPELAPKFAYFTVILRNTRTFWLCVTHSFPYADFLFLPSQPDNCFLHWKKILAKNMRKNLPRLNKTNRYSKISLNYQSFGFFTRFYVNRKFKEKKKKKKKKMKVTLVFSFLLSIKSGI